MLGMGKHIHGTNSAYIVFLFQKEDVPSLCCGIAGDVNDFAWGYLQYLFDHALCHSGSRRVGDYDLRTTVSSYEIVVEYLRHVACMEYCVVYAIVFGIRTCVFHRVLHIFHAYDFLCRACNVVGYRSATCI